MRVKEMAIYILLLKIHRDERMRKSMKKKIVALITAICLCAGSVFFPVDGGVTVQAAFTEEKKSGDYRYKILEDGTVEITDYEGKDAEITIPTELDGIKVTSIGNRVFFGCKTLSSVMVPENVISIGSEAFYACRNMISITLPESLTSLGDRALYGCEGLTSVALPESLTSIGNVTFGGCTNLADITLPENLTSTGNGTFLECTNLADITLPKSLTFIGASAFQGCKSLTSIILPESLTSIGASAFNYCSSLTTINIPESVTTIPSAFWECSSLTSITLPPNVTSIEGEAFHGCTSLTSITIPESVTDIGVGAFWGCSSLTEVNIPSNITMIRPWTFLECSSLSNIVIPESVTNISINAFTGTSITNITLPNVTYIDVRAFAGCPSLTSITLPNCLTTIETGAFMNCNNLKDVYFTGTKEQWQKIAISEDNEVLSIATIHFADGTTSKDPETVPDTNIQMNDRNVALSKTSLTYNGKAQKPTVTVKDGNGNFVNSKNYTLEYANNKNVGQAMVMVTFNGNYKGTVKKTFNIVPKGTSITQITAKKKGFALKWKKQTTQTTGYEIQYSTSSKFKGAKTLKNIKAKTSSKSISKLKANKKYYVRIRTYKTVKGKKYYSDWSKARNKKTKK